jgi:hypothetical protein
MTGKKVVCPSCGNSKVSFYYCTNKTIFYCQDPRCDTIGRIAFVSHHWAHQKYPEVIAKVGWDDADQWGRERDEKSI